MIKKLGVIALLAALLSTSALASGATNSVSETGFTQGTRELGFSGSADFDSNILLNRSTLIDAEASYGVFITDSLEVLGVGAIIFTEKEIVGSIAGVRGEYHLPSLGTAVPFVGLGANWLHSDDLGNTASLDTGLFDAALGVKYMLSPSVALTGRIVYEYALDDIFYEGANKASSADNWGFDWGLRFYY